MSGRRDEVHDFLHRVRVAVETGHVRVSHYAIDRATEELGWEAEDIFFVLEDLGAEDFHRREASARVTGDTIWVFTPIYEVGPLWVRLLEREGVLVVSFHLR